MLSFIWLKFSTFFRLMPICIKPTPHKESAGAQQQKRHLHINRGRECVRMGAAGAQTLRSLGHHFMHLLILRVLVLCATTDFETQSSLLQNRLHSQIQISNSCPEGHQATALELRCQLELKIISLNRHQLFQRGAKHYILYRI